MKLHQTGSQGRNLITACETGRIRINQDVHQGNLIITPDSVEHWEIASFEALTPQDFAALLRLSPEVVLFGTGTRQRFPHPRLTAELAQAGVGIEVMDTPAACRSFNILLAEERRVVAVLLNETPDSQ